MADKKKNLSEYQELKEKRLKGLSKEFEEFIQFIKGKAVLKTVQLCEKEANKTGQYDEIDEKVCIRSR